MGKILRALNKYNKQEHTHQHQPMYAAMESKVEQGLRYADQKSLKKKKSNIREITASIDESLNALKAILNMKEGN